MGQRLTQRIYECSLCERVPEDGEYMWHMGNEVWCEKCVDTEEEEFYCVSSDALVYGKPCKTWCGDECCKELCK